MLDLVWLIPALPLLGFLVILVAGRKMGDPGAGYFATAMVALSFVVTAGVFIDLQSLDAEARTEQVPTPSQPRKVTSMFEPRINISMLKANRFRYRKNLLNRLSPCM